MGERMLRTGHTAGRFGLSFWLPGLIFLAGLLSVCAPAHARARAQAKPPHPLKQDESCLACHGQAGMTSGSGKSISIDPAKHAASVHGILGCTDCHTTIKDYPHPAKVARRFNARPATLTRLPMCRIACTARSVTRPANPATAITTKWRRRPRLGAGEVRAVSCR